MFTFPTINKSSPHANGLRYCWPMFGHTGAVKKEVMQGADLTTLTSGDSVAGPSSSILTPAYNGTSHYGVAFINLGDVRNLTLSFWMYWDVNTTNDDLCLEYTAWADNGTGGGGNGIYCDPNNAAGFIVAAGGTAGGHGRWFTRPSAAAWHHYVALIDRAQTGALRCVPAVYVDGRSVALTSADASGGVLAGNFHAADNFYFMSRGGTSLYGPGRLCDVRIYPGKLLSPAEAWSLYDPRTRWDLYAPIEQPLRWSWVTEAALPEAPAGGLALLGVGR